MMTLEQLNMLHAIAGLTLLCSVSLIISIVTLSGLGAIWADATSIRTISIEDIRAR